MRLTIAEYACVIVFIGILDLKVHKVNLYMTNLEWYKSLEFQTIKSWEINETVRQGCGQDLKLGLYKKILEGTFAVIFPVDCFHTSGV